MYSERVTHNSKSVCVGGVHRILTGRSWERTNFSLIFFWRRRITPEQQQFCNDLSIPPRSRCPLHCQQSTDAQWGFYWIPIEWYQQVSLPMPLELLLQEHLCLVVCSNVCTQLLIASSSRCPGPGHSLPVSVLVKILLLYFVCFSTTLCTLLFLPLFHVLQHCPE